jgi:DNA (cytosine-5)-methyltransferase 1
MIKLATLFSGIGAIEQALKQLNLDYEISFACDNGERELHINKEEVETKIKNLKSKDKKLFVDKLYLDTRKTNLMEKSYKANYIVSDEDFYQDVRFLDGAKYKNRVDILVGGSPCQAFSVNGKRGGLEDIRGTLFYDYARIVMESQPKIFIFENVRGMLNHDGGKTWDIIKKTFKNLNYKIFINEDEEGKESPILNSLNYGIPQKRERLFVVGFRNDIVLKNNFSFPKEIELNKTIYDYLEEFVEAKYYLGKKGFEFVTTHPSRARVGNKIMGCQKANQQFNWNGDFIFEKYDTIKNRKDILDRAFVSEWNGEKGVIRKYTPRECLRLMGFNDDFKIVVSDQHMYRQTGNSIVVNVLVELVKEIIRTGVFD